MVGLRLFFRNLTVEVSKEVKVLEATLDETPPPAKYLTVKVVFEGAIPYELVKIKLVGLYAVVNLVRSNGKPNPTLVGFGIISSSLLSALPDPN